MTVAPPKSVLEKCFAIRGSSSVISGISVTGSAAAESPVATGVSTVGTGTVAVPPTSGSLVQALMTNMAKIAKVQFFHENRSFQKYFCAILTALISAYIYI
ncbi:MAG: hypothetical protein FWG68_06810, partial [Defluviitaleaceae bacterium]|nr:hypothetical protein [Defluviitaleaceae bacterium]